MKPEMEAKLRALLQKRSDDKVASEVRMTAEAERRTSNLEAFTQAVKTTIRPAMQEIVQLYTAQGIPARILEKSEEGNSRGGTSQPYIRVSLEPEAGSHRNDRLRTEFTVYFDKEKNEIWLHKSTHSGSSPGERLPLGRVSSDWIQEQFVAYASHAF